MTFNYSNIPHLPSELVDMIADYHDYTKYCRPQHYELLKGIINDIGSMAAIHSDDANLAPRIAWQCWGIGTYTLNDFEWNPDEHDYDDYWNEIMDDFVNHFDDYSDDDEDNFSLDNDERHYPLHF